MLISERRRHERVWLPGSYRGSLAHDEVPVVNLSLGGALVLHTSALTPGEERLLTLPIAGVDVAFRTRNIWSRSATAEHFAVPFVRVWVGLQFIDLSAFAALDLGRYLTTIRPQPD